MMLPIEPLGLKATQWQFLGEPRRYVDASARAGRELVAESTARQFDTARDILERLNGSYGEDARRGVLLADDVGLGKTTVAALIAWVVASAGEKRGVRILAPNDVMMRRWEEELLSHVAPLQECAPFLGVKAKSVKARRVERLSAGSIQVVKHSYAASDWSLTCDLLIVDEAHRAKGEKTAFSEALKRQKKHARRVLILTATPFSIRLEELLRMLKLIGGDAATRPVTAFSRALDDLYSGNPARSQELIAQRLAIKAKAAIEALSGCVVRHSVDDLKREHNAFGSRGDWRIDVPDASKNEIELLLRMDRAQRVAESTGATNSPRFHVGWRFFDTRLRELVDEAKALEEPRQAVVELQCKTMYRLRRQIGVHSKMKAVGAAVKHVVDAGEKVLLFCHHHATAQELTVHLSALLPRKSLPSSPSTSKWRAAWKEVLGPPGEEHRHEELLQATFIEWLCSELVRSQTWSWIVSSRASPKSLVRALEVSRARSSQSRETIAQAARSLYRGLLQSKSSRGVLKAAADGRLDLIPGANGAARVLGVCPESDDEDEAALFIHNQQPDTVISVFNSPFGPDVLVVTDKLSEGIDLHRYCRHLVHYELDPSPIRTVQRNGRVRRVNSWASITGQPIMYAFPAFRGTRDHRLVQIMKKRIDSFSLLLGGVQDIELEEVRGSEERWRNEVIALAKGQLEKTGRALQANPSGGESLERVAVG